MQAATRVNAGQASKRQMRKPTHCYAGEGRGGRARRATAPDPSAGVVAAACMDMEIDRNTGSPRGESV
jgi:hypothetical protein